MPTLGLLLMVALAAFVVLMGFAMAAYPGGNFYEPKRAGHHFWFNFMCDLLRAQGLDGRPNTRGAKLSLAGMLMLAVAIVLYFVVAPSRMGHLPRAATAVAILGPVASVGLIAVALLPSDRFPRLHTVALLTAALPGLVACALAIGAVVVDPRAANTMRALGIGVFVALLGTFALYARHTFLGGGFLRALPAMQRVAVLLAVAWLAMTGWSVYTG